MYTSSKRHFIRNLAVFTTLLLPLCSTAQAQTQPLTQPNSIQKAKVGALYARTPLAFEANSGQSDPRVKFTARGQGYGLYLNPTSATLVLSKSTAKHKPGIARLGKAPAKPELPAKITTSRLQMKLLGANANASGSLEQMLPGRTNYLIGNDSKRWRTDVRTYAKTRFREVYRGVDLVYYGNNGTLEYDFVVKPGADPRAIRLSFGGAESLKVDGHGDLVARLGAGEVRWHRPALYQQISGKRVQVAGKFVMKQQRQVGFEIARYDAAQPLVIDPELVYSTYLGGTGDDWANAIAVDSVGNAYVAGYTYSLDFPVKNASQWQLNATQNAFVTKINAQGQLVYSTYLGGSGDDDAGTIAVDSVGNAYIAGYTQSQDFPVKHAFQGQNNGNYDGFVTKLNAQGQLVYSTYLGGTDYDWARSIAVDSVGNAYVAGSTLSSDFAVKNAFQWQNNGNYDGFVTKLDTQGQLVYSTYLGGTDYDLAASIAVDSVGNAFIAGQTHSGDFPVKNAFQWQLSGTQNAFVTKLNAQGQLVYSTYLGGSGGDEAMAIALDSVGNAYIAGYTYSYDFPVKNTFQGQLNGSSDAFVTKLNAQGQLVYSTYLGGSNIDSAESIAVDSIGNAYVAGWTSSDDFPVKNAFQWQLNGSQNAFVTKLNTPGQLVYSTYLGGTNNDWARSIVLDSVGNAYVAGSTQSSDFPVKNALQAQNNGGADAFIVKIGDSTGSIPCRFDLHGNGSSDILWSNSVSGAVAVWQMNAGNYMSCALLPTVADKNWVPVGVGDFNGDMSNDILWQNRATGEVGFWPMNKTSQLAPLYVPLTKVSDTTWQIVAVADFNADGKPDLLWRNKATGQNLIWLMSGTSYLSTSMLPAVADQGWKVAGVADFNGDGAEEIIFQHAVTGQIVYWQLNGAAYTGCVNYGSMDTAWQITGTGNFGGANGADLLWRNKTTGEVLIWKMKNGVWQSTIRLYTTPLDWQIQGMR